MVGVMSSFGFAHIRQLRHVSMMCDTIAITAAGNEAALSIRPIAARGRATILDATFAPLTFVDPPWHASGFSSVCLFAVLFLS